MISFILVSVYLQTSCSQIIFSPQDFLTHHISRFYKKILKYQYFWLKIVLTDTIAILYIYEYDFNLCFLYEKNMI